ncbi:bifunctional 2-polyprenyl-6-hydroxyphenol methylase/3-demethylubiquinol 3-O-methyltransferase UbiG [Bradyrhizobium sp. Ec3.3]|uniref:class I SAM-dependent methyltransferase n=1 Tax=Bradyrhizobium sp. Ec3.3 TaxID=189753 RepID=UPI0006879E7B|nr:methyltransferase domain-containing protein [Bradyrhizobium sp. Ec3.3]
MNAGVAPYDAKYFERYEAMADTAMGRALNWARCDLVRRYTKGAVVDIGIGAGTFIRRRMGFSLLPTYGYDVNPAGIAWLKKYGVYLNPYECESVDAITCWDVLEHIPDFETLVNRVKHFVFVSIPIFRDASHALTSKHFRPDEHCWYFTSYGLKAVFDTLGFDCVEENDKESRLGREDVMSFVFKRRAADERYHPEWTLSDTHHAVLQDMRAAAKAPAVNSPAYLKAQSELTARVAEREPLLLGACKEARACQHVTCICDVDPTEPGR